LGFNWNLSFWLKTWICSNIKKRNDVLLNVKRIVSKYNLTEHKAPYIVK